jgi:imidazolonepropionase-like amidohydrolase
MCMKSKYNSSIKALLILSCAVTQAVLALEHQPAGVLYENVRIFNGRSEQLSKLSNVLVVGNVIKTISTSPIAAPPATALTRIDGGGRTLMPGLIDAHSHISVMGVSMSEALNADIGYVHLAAGKAAEAMLLRGFTTVRDMGGPSFGLKRAIDNGLIPGPRIFPSGTLISQTGGHGDFRLPYEIPRAAGDPLSYSERIGLSAIADSPDEVRRRARENLMKGASQIKLTAGGGVGSEYDPLDVSQFSQAELHAAVEVAENWGTYVTVHAYTPRAIRVAIAAGVKVIEHGQLTDEATVKLMADKGIWWCLQPLLDDADWTPLTGSRRVKQLSVAQGTDVAYALAKKYKVKTAWGTDLIFSPELASSQGEMLAKLVRWYRPGEVLKVATGDNAELLALSGLRSPYAGKLGVVEEGALADLLLVDGDPLANIKLIEDPARNFLVIMKDGNIYKNHTATSINQAIETK